MEPSVSGPDKDAPDQPDEGQGRRSHSPKGRFSAEELGKRAKSIGSLGIIPIILAAGPILGIFIGMFLDEKFDTSPWLSILFIIFGFVASTKQIIKLLKSEEDQGNGKNRHRGARGSK